MIRKPRCEICGKKSALFYTYTTLTEIKACSECITDQLLTGWSR